MSIKKIGPGNYEYKGEDGTSLLIERAAPRSKGHVYMRMRDDVIWIQPGDVAAFIEAVREAAREQRVCSNCDGAGFE